MKFCLCVRNLKKERYEELTYYLDSPSSVKLCLFCVAVFRCVNGRFPVSVTHADADASTDTDAEVILPQIVDGQTLAGHGQRGIAVQRRRVHAESYCR